MVEGRPVLSTQDVPFWTEKFGLSSESAPLRTIKELPSYDDVNYHIVTAEGSEYVLKAHNGMIPAGKVNRLHAQNRLIERLAQSGLPVPKVLATADGTSSVLSMNMKTPGMTDIPPENQAAHVRILTYLQGEIVGNEVPKDDDFLQSVGKTVGQITKALAGFEDKDAVWDWDWHMKNVVEVCRARASFISDPNRISLAETFISQYATALPPDVLASLPHSVTHSDLNDTNLLFEGTDVVGILDFGDSIYTCTVFDVGIAAGYYSLAQADPLHVFGMVLKGYLSECPLSEAEMQAFYHSAYGRVLLSACMSAQACAAEPDNEYLAHTAEPGWRVLEKLKGVSPDAALTLFRGL